MKTIVKTTAIAICTFLATSVQAQQLMTFEENRTFGFKDQNGKIIIAPKYTGAEDFSEGLACVSLNDVWGFIDETGKVVIPFKYNAGYGTGHKFSQGLAAVNLNDKYGYIDKTGKTVIPFEYNEAWDFRSEKNYDGTPKIYAHVRKGSDEFCIDKTGKRIRCWSITKFKQNDNYHKQSSNTIIRLLVR